MEIWKDIKGYEGVYMVSNMGRVKSLPRYTGAAHECNLEERVLTLIEKKDKKNKVGYLVVSLKKNKKPRSEYVHRIVAKAFLENPENKPTVNHINGNKHDNRVENLEWATYAENNQHAHDIKLVNLKNKAGSIPVYQYDLNYNLIAVYPSMREAERQTKVHIKGIMDGIKKGWRFGGYIWKTEPVML